MFDRFFARVTERAWFGPLPKERRVARYAAGVLAFAAAFALREAAPPFTGRGVRLDLYYPAAMLATTLGGLGPGSVCLGLALTAEVALAEHPPPAAELLRLSLFALIGAAVVVLIEALRRSRASLTAALARADALIEAAPNAIIVTRSDGAIAFANSPAERLFQYSRGELVGMPIETLVPPRYRAGHSGYLQGFMAAPGARPMGFGRDLYGLRKDGSEVPVEIGLGPFRTAEGLFVLASIIDITGRKRAETELHAALERYDVATRGAGVGTWQLTLAKPMTSSVLEWSELLPALFGFPAEVRRPKLKNVMRRIHPGDRLRVRRAFGAAIVRRAPYREEYRVVWPDGSTHWLASTGRALAGADGRIDRVIGVTFDVTQRRVAEEAAKEATLALEQRVAERTQDLRSTVSDLERFTYTVAHDLRAPLRAVHRYCELLESRHPDLPLDARRCLEHVTEGARRMDHLIVDLLTYSQVGRGEARLEPLDLGAAARDVVASLADEIRKRGAEVRVPAGVLPNAVADRALLCMAVANLLANALKFMPPGRRPEVEVDAERHDGWVELSVKDNGIGIPPEYRERVFHVFERLHAGSRYPGAGIGLAIVDKAARRMGGQAGFESEPGRGSRFWLRLKAAPPP